MKPEDFIVHVIQTDIPETYQPVVKLIGIDNFLKLCQHCMGDRIYFPMTDTVFRKTRNRMISREYNIYNVKELAKKYDLTVEQVRNIVKESSHNTI